MPRSGDFEGVLFGNCDGEVIVQSDGVLVRRSLKGCLSVHQTGLGRVMCGLGVFVRLVDNRLLRDIKTKVAVSFLLRRPY